MYPFGKLNVQTKQYLCERRILSYFVLPTVLTVENYRVWDLFEQDQWSTFPIEQKRKKGLELTIIHFIEWCWTKTTHCSWSWAGNAFVRHENLFSKISHLRSALIFGTVSDSRPKQIALKSVIFPSAWGRTWVPKYHSCSIQHTLWRFYCFSYFSDLPLVPLVLQFMN